VIALVERAKEELVSSLPSPRGVQRVQLAEALLRFEEDLRSASDEMEGSRPAGREDVWRGCRDALDESLRRAERLRLEAPALDYEGLVSILAELIDPLEAFAEAESNLSRPT
jgi:hypothetical protein